jgi:hypothetical protein
MLLNFPLSVALLAILLFFPVSRMVSILSIRRLQRKLARNLSATEIAGQKRRARVIALVLVVPFSWLFNLQLQGLLHG